MIRPNQPSARQWAPVFRDWDCRVDDYGEPIADWLMKPACYMTIWGPAFGSEERGGLTIQVDILTVV